VVGRHGLKAAQTRILERERNRLPERSALTEQYVALLLLVLINAGLLDVRCPNFFLDITWLTVLAGIDRDPRGDCTELKPSTESYPANRGDFADC
jgi:hypothetical protein